MGDTGFQSRFRGRRPSRRPALRRAADARGDEARAARVDQEGAARGDEEDDSSRVEDAAVGLGLFSLALGLGELVAPRALLRLVGVRPGARRASVLRGLGAREVVVGAGLLAGKRSAPWLWARVAGDVVDLALCASALRGRRPRGAWAAGALAALGAITALDTWSAMTASREEGQPPVAPAIPNTKPEMHAGGLDPQGEGQT